MAVACRSFDGRVRKGDDFPVLRFFPWTGEGKSYVIKVARNDDKRQEIRIGSTESARMIEGRFMES